MSDKQPRPSPYEITLGTSAELGLVRRNELLATADILGVRRVRLGEPTARSSDVTGPHRRTARR